MVAAVTHNAHHLEEIRFFHQTSGSKFHGLGADRFGMRHHHFDRVVFIGRVGEITKIGKSAKVCFVHCLDKAGQPDGIGTQLAVVLNDEVHVARGREIRERRTAFHQAIP